MKKYFLFGLFIIVLSLFMTRVYFHKGFPYTHDGENHLARFSNYAIAVREGQIPPRFAPNLMNHYGYPVFDFNYPLANILSLPFSAIKLNYEFTFKALIFLSVAFGCCGSFCWLQKLGLKRTTKILGMAVFALNVYLLNAIVFRGNIGEIFSICLLPWMFWSVETVTSPNFMSWKKIAAVLIATAFWLSHNIAAVFSIPFLISYAAVSLRWQKKSFIYLTTFFLVSISLSLWFWLPALVEKSATVVDSAGINVTFFDHFPTFNQLLFGPLKFGFSYAGPIDSLSFSLGIFQVACLVIGSLELLLLGIEHSTDFFSHKKNRLYAWGISILMCLIFFQLSISQPIWKIFFPIAKYLQFPWRLSMFWGVLTIPVFALCWEGTSKLGKFILGVCFIWQIIILSRIIPVDYFHRQVQDYNYFPQSTSTLNENRSKTFTYLDIGDWQPSPQVFSGDAQIVVQSWRGSRRQYDLTVQKNSTIVEPTMYFLGWQTQANNQTVTYVNSPEIGGRIAYTLPPGKYHIKSVFTQWTWSRIVGNTTSVVMAFLILLWMGRLTLLSRNLRYEEHS
jgi:hypothetical protein